MDEVFRALADPSRRRLLDSLNARNGQSLRELCAGLDMARQSVSKHLKVLEDANLISTVWQGREKLHYLNAEPINAIADRWINHYDRLRAQTLADLKTALERNSMAHNNDFVYTTYIRTTPELLWQAVTDPAFSERYMGHGLVTDWKVGSTFQWRDGDLNIAGPEQVVLECDPYRRLAFTFHTFTKDLTAVGLSEEIIERAAAEPRSTVTFDMEPVDDGRVKLTVTHTGFPEESTVRQLVSGGWPSKLSDLKSHLEQQPAVLGS
ncbi:ArsR/SmtB family transcription factor [Mycolicibacterium parafortuitum]|uniref:ArsR family transcriptional regulator [Kribbella flavida DSM] n=1 Tax=Mycolicibacterium parafortuitum TaxID=39692 RepID=A0A375YRA0_MYCPF|nr:metalloregulator ArsR/SmtB family transcription factor [Mycolicibacterium parafortuitum]ORB29463.1 ArsR family transcriptional regulator [Mycolicibacterium parafortuitum]SRX83632.1 ArsR family transcriptional regulator [Kribbella flavida DSM] [Mycolicibacterium parafortuitum]